MGIFQRLDSILIVASVVIFLFYILNSERFLQPKLKNNIKAVLMNKYKANFAIRSVKESNVSLTTVMASKLDLNMTEVCTACFELNSTNLQNNITLIENGKCAEMERVDGTEKQTPSKCSFLDLSQSQLLFKSVECTDCLPPVPLLAQQSNFIEKMLREYNRLSGHKDYDALHIEKVSRLVEAMHYQIRYTMDAWTCYALLEKDYHSNLIIQTNDCY